MPNFPPGTGQAVAPAVTPTWVFTPTPSVKSPSIRLFNTGTTYPVYVGGADVTQFNGLPIYPGNKPVEFQVMPTTIYACSAAQRNTNATGTLASATTAGTTAITLAAAVPAGLAAGTTILIGSTANTSSMEANVVNSTTASSQLTFLNPLLYDHASATVVYTATLNTGSLSINAGAS
jgi:hypothetical protein